MSGLAIASMLEAEDAQSIEGADEALEKVTGFIKNIIESLETEGEFVFSVFHHGRGSEGEDPVFSSEIEPQGNYKSLAKEIVEAAVEDVSSFMKGTHKYVVRAENVRGRCLFSLKVNQPDEDEDDDDIDEAPNKKGLMGLLMRHQQVTLNLATATVKNVMSIQSQTIKESKERIKELEEHQLQTIRLTEDLMSGRHIRDLELRKLDNREKRMNEIAGVVLQGAPMLLSMVANSGGGSAPEAAPMVPASTAPATSSQLESIVEGLMGSFTSEQFQKIASSGLFDPMQIMALVEIAKNVKAKQAAKEAAEAASKAVANRPVPHDNKT